jgi:hypothetical protein
MRFDLLTLYVLAVGTLLLSTGMTLWERQARPQRRRELVRLDPGIPAAYETDVVARDDAVERGAGDTDKVAAVLSSSTPT